VGDTINKCPPISNYSLDWWRNRNSRELESWLLVVIEYKAGTNERLLFLKFTANIFEN
jgi:hypothetical protein